MPIKGIIPPLITPLNKNNELDSQGLRNLIEHVLDGEVHALFVLGTTGEGPSLCHSIRKQMVTETCAIVDKRVTVLVCITDTSFVESLELARHAKNVGADFLVLAPPYYYPISQTEMQSYLKVLAPQLPLPFLMYNMPGCTKLHLSLETVKIAKDLGAIGIKDSSGDREYLMALVEEFKQDQGFSIITGNEAFLPELIEKGGHGTVAGGANFFPKLFVALFNACGSQNSEAITKHLDRVKWISNTIYNIGNEESRYVKATKSTLAAMGLCEDYSSLPIQRYGEAEKAQLQNYLAEFNYEDEYPAK